ncbi:hypothetical protein [Pseudanabaena yagii]|uniref:EF-hand domain-containing protein n=1 Tax=Pseudanabaena yagii GIHE-NHR1 TaxID=2722753 RepID=A0ABX1M1K3_9CYAN|nr:hypothetical protein [Pseudanabaena yagii]NMF60914.1 hypothetical protein [Pseudanabaena yagii GIHE-NHR1]
MFAQFRSQYPQGRIQTEMLPKIDGLHAFRAIVSQGDAIMGTATAVDSDLEIAEDRAVKRALTIAGIAFDNGFDSNYGNYAGRSPILTQVSREPASVNSLPSANLNNLGSLGAGHHTTTHTIQSEPALEYANEYGANDYTDDSLQYASIEPPSRSHEEILTRPSDPVPTPSKSSTPTIAPEPIDLSDAISKIDVEMDRLNWTKTQGRDYLVRTFDKKSRQQLTNDELLQFLSHLKSLPTPYRQPANNDDFF